MAWRTYCKATWGRVEYKTGDLYRKIAEEHSQLVHPSDRVLSLTGCGVTGDAEALWRSVQKRTGDHFDFLDPRPSLEQLQANRYLCQGRSDDVIPYAQIYRLLDATPDHVQCKAFVTRMYDHTGSSHLGQLGLEGPPLLQEARSILGMVYSVVDAGSVQRSTRI